MAVVRTWTGPKRYHQSPEYQRQYRLEHAYDLCECGSRKRKTSQRCRPCSVKARPKHPEQTVGAANLMPQAEISRRYRLWTEIRDKFVPLCPYCSVPLSKRLWHETAYYRCGGCGLEVTPMEIRRIQVYEAA